MTPETNQNLHEQMPHNSGAGEVWSFFLDLVIIAAIAAAIIIPFRIFIAEPFVVSGSSMLPNFHNKDYLIIDRLSYRHSQPARGDVIVLKYPKDTTQYFIKRIIGLPGETICFPQGHVLISKTPITAQQCEAGDGTILDEPYLPSQLETVGPVQPITLGEGQYFVLGDNRMASSDSRIWGILPQDDIVGRVWLRIFPLSRFGLIPHQSYNQQ